MVFITRLTVAATVAALFSCVAAQDRVKITNPTGSSWWVAKSQNVVTWDCKAPGVPDQFTILVGNKDINVLTSNIAVVAIQNNFDCSKVITQDQANQPAGLGYRIIFADIVNNTNIYGQSEEFEIKALGSAYPTTSVAGGASATGSGAAPGSSQGANGNNTNSALSSKHAAGFGLAAVGTVFGLML